MGSHYQRYRFRRSLPPGVLVALVLAAAMSLWPAPADAHPLGNFTVNQYSRLDFSDDGVRISYVLDFAEIPTVDEMKRLDPDGDGQISESEANTYLDAEAAQVIAGLSLVIGDETVPLSVVDRGAIVQAGQGGLAILRVAIHLSGSLPDGWEAHGDTSFTDRNYKDQVGWREIVVQGGPGVDIANSTALSEDETNELLNYPSSALSSAPNMREVTFTLVPAAAAPAAAVSTPATITPVRGSGGGATARVTDLVTVKRLTPTVILISMLAALFWGAVHALTPGHGKTIVAAYLVGARGTAKHAAFLGLAVTVTHTAGVFALGLVTLYLSHFILPETLFRWLGVASGLLVVGIGVTLALKRLGPLLRKPARKPDGAPEDASIHEHDHPHEHLFGSHAHTHAPLPDAGTTLTWSGLLALGVSGGLIPCPSALILLLGAIALNRLEFGIVLVLAFSVGLAAVLTAVGLLLVYGRRIFQRFSMELRVPRFLPVASALVISIAGVMLVLSSLGKTGMI